MRTLKPSILVVLAALPLSVACGGSMRAATADEIGCDANDVQLFDPEEKAGQETWIARCTGNRREYTCTRADGSDQVSCEPIKADETGASHE